MLFLSSLSKPFCMFYNDKYKSHCTVKAMMVCLGFETGPAEWQGQTNPLSYGDPRPFLLRYSYYLLKSCPPTYTAKRHQICARYLEGDNISTKIGSGRVEIEIGEASPTFKISEAIRGKSRPISTLPDF